MAGQMRVDLSELEETVRKLRRLTSDMGSAKTDSTYRTDVPARAWGERFAEATELDTAHREMKKHLEDMIDYLNEVIDDFGTKTQTVHGKYQDSEHEAKRAHGGA